MDQIAAPPEQTIANAHAESDLDAKLRDAAERNHARGSTGQPTRVVSIVDRVLEMTATAVPVTTVHVAASFVPVPRAITDDVRREITPKRFALSSFENYEPANPSQKMALRTAMRWVEAARNGDGPMLALVGPTGTGKSHLLYAAANALIGTHFPAGCYARPWYKLADELRYGGKSPFMPASKTGLEASEVRALLWEQKIILLDEVRVTSGTAFDDTELAKFACWAYDAKLAVFITSNVSPLAEVMGPPAASRFAQVVIEGPDWRQSA